MHDEAEIHIVLAGKLLQDADGAFLTCNLKQRTKRIPKFAVLPMRAIKTELQEGNLLWSGWRNEMNLTRTGGLG
ncbi:hypothetical protein HI914_05565 [Erysiphe necator]|nr:hypothetical protein HI914_05565 [Erysiphe necator]